MPGNMSHEKWLDQGFKQMEESDRFCDYEKEVIAAVRTSNFSVSTKSHFYTLLMDYGTEKIHSRNLANRLEKSYHDADVERLVDKVVWFNPKLGYVSIEGGFEGLDERNNYNCYLSIPVAYDSDVDKYFENAKPIMDKAKQVVRLLITDAKKMWSRR